MKYLAILLQRGIEERINWIN